jgi:hypothetical protein
VKYDPENCVRLKRGPLHCGHPEWVRVWHGVDAFGQEAVAIIRSDGDTEINMPAAAAVELAQMLLKQAGADPAPWPLP